MAFPIAQAGFDHFFLETYAQIGGIRLDQRALLVIAKRLARFAVDPDLDIAANQYGNLSLVTSAGQRSAPHPSFPGRFGNTPVISG